MASRGGRSGFVGLTQKFRVVKDNRTKQKEDSETVTEVFRNRDSSNEHAISNDGDRSITSVHICDCPVSEAQLKS
uniref:Uncharacterized protein n=1 Tax=Arundo donax TaxID=35708 RepID=A0A0A8XQY1_ARUDO